MDRHGTNQQVQATTVTWVGGRPADLLTQALPGSDEVEIPVLFHLATPSMPLPFLGMPGAMRAALLPGIRPITYFRPGYAATKAHPGRSVADAAADTAAVLDAWDIEKAVLYGGSGGGPHALACAALIPDRVAGVVIDGSPAPFELIGDAGFEGMAGVNRIGYDMAMASDGDLLPKMRAVFDPSAPVDDPEGIVAQARTVIDEEGLPFGSTPTLFADLLGESGAGWADDVSAITSPWGFGLADIACPVHVFFGDRDELTPPAHGRFLAKHIPTAIAHPYEGDHLALAWRLPEVVAALTACWKEAA